MLLRCVCLMITSRSSSLLMIRVEMREDAESGKWKFDGDGSVDEE